jgi:hypothetical protein
LPNQAGRVSLTFDPLPRNDKLQLSGYPRLLVPLRDPLVPSMELEAASFQIANLMFQYFVAGL